MTVDVAPAVWFLAVRTGSGTDTFTRDLAQTLRDRGARVEITWLPLRAEYAPWTVAVPRPPVWATVAHIDTWLHRRFLPASIPVVATLHHSMHDPALRPYKSLLRAIYHRLWIHPLERNLLRHVDRIVAVSHFVAGVARRTLTSQSITVVPNGVDVETFCPGNPNASGRPFRLVFVGKWATLKGVDLLAPIMRELGADFMLDCIGVDPRQLHGDALPGNMRLLGRVADKSVLVAALQQADAFLFPSRSEGMPLSVLEAMACGLPVIAADGSSVVELVEPGANGRLCPRDDVAAFASACRELAAAPDLLARMSAHARARAVAEFSLSRMCEAYMGIYQAVSKRGGQDGGGRFTPHSSDRLGRQRGEGPDA